MRRTGTTRRSALTATGAVALGAVLTGCGDGPRNRDLPGGADARTAALRERTALRAAAARDSASLLSRYEQVAAAHPLTEAGIAPMGAAVRAHLAALGGPAKAAGTSPPPSPPATPADARAALRELAAEERRVADGRATALLNAEPELARLLASIAAAGAAHAYLLTELAKETPA
ncbi:hypothetical protein OOK43_04025 [[Kitasatospora] papulosa]|uniref:hypothetical protein n=1 Tax=Streptomyces TaxID=1883 RepID=UPI0002C6DFD2|nr:MULTISPECIES: hypothetical protein [Streptomyces]MDF9869785.1 hypothetical protein [Streptomyces pratensis]RAS25489.1 hypothetical protein BCL80_112131 [Streptomyces avidinii]SNX80086.1 hypothetical protein SAMN05421860_109387 [Streptomyces microflavus]AGJ57645.1 hypothetical protein F750_5212 [Streptomyces sp. PAMC 26508]MCX4412448.1 hypothetical protein [[Kitasatospora] papulosa]